MSKHDTQPAFPSVHSVEKNGSSSQYQTIGGLTQRDYFAAHAPEPPASWRGGDRGLVDVIAWRWWYADAMLKAREV
jgi:hypothetical protein